MKYTKAILFILPFTIALIFFSCEKGIEPEKIEPGRRDYVWTVDTATIFNTYLMKMWGSSPTDVWAVGSGSSMDCQIWHFDGNNWTTDGISRGILPWCIYGFAQNDIWIGGSDGDIWHYDGTEWSMSLAYSKELNYKYSSIYFMDIWGGQPDDIYAVGLADSSDVRFGLIMHYDGTKWSRINIEFTEGVLMKIKKETTSDNYYIMHFDQQAYPDSTQFSRLDGINLKSIYYDVGYPHDLSIVNNELLFAIKNNIYTYSNNKFNHIIKNPFSNSWDAIYGRNRNDIIWMMPDGLTHYNGTDFKYILNFENFQLNDGFIRLKDGFLFEKEVFFVSHGDNNNYIFHGILK